MEKEFSTFRKATFGGFNRKDVISYIEKMRNESFEYKKQVEETVKSLNEKISELENAARLMENSIADEVVADEEAPCEQSLGDIGQATKHLKTVADELCRSLGDFMDKLSEKGLFEKKETACETAEEETACEPETMSLVDGILASISYLDETEKTEKKEATEEIRLKSVSDILSGYSFLK